MSGDAKTYDCANNDRVIFFLVFCRENNECNNFALFGGIFWHIVELYVTFQHFLELSWSFEHIMMFCQEFSFVVIYALFWVN